MMTALALVALLGQGIPTEAEVKRAEAKLADKPDDPAANLTVGKYLAWTKSDWEGAGPFIERGSDPILKKAFQADAAGGKTGPEMIGVGDEWVSAGDKRTDMKKPCRERAIYWYAKAWPLVEDPWKLKLRLQLRKLACPPPGSEKSKKSAGNPAGWPQLEAYWGAFLETGFSWTGRRSIRVIPPPKENESRGSGFHSATFPAPAGEKVQVSMWVYSSETDTPSGISVRFFDQANKFIGYGGPKANCDSPWWQYISAEVSVPSGAVWMDVNAGMESSCGSMWVDEVSLKVGEKEFIPNGGFEK